MVRTKDLVLFVSVLAMLFLAISATLANRILHSEPSDRSFLSNVESAHPAYEATTNIEERDRVGAIERLRALLAEGDVIDAAPSVTEPAESETEPVASTSAIALNCAAPTTGIEVARLWPLEDVVVKTAEGVRIVNHIVYAPTPVGTTTEPQILSQRTLLQLPLEPSVQAEPVCLDTEIIGVTVEGSLIFNNDAVLHRHTGVETLIGYARDGFPIYGAYAGPQDQCGGYQSATGYRYAASPNESTFINCFTGALRSFNP